jgi:hypothetical protein
VGKAAVRTKRKSKWPRAKVGERLLFGPHTCRVGLCGRDGTVGVDLPAGDAGGCFRHFVRVYFCAKHAEEHIARL